MANSTQSTRPGRKSTGGTSSPAAADRSNAIAIRQRNFPSVEPAVNRKVVSEVETPQMVLNSRPSHSSKSSVASTSSFFSTESSKRSSLFDPPTSSPSQDSLPTSPEDSTPEFNQGTPSKVSVRPGLQKTDDDVQLSSGSESPALNARKRRKDSMTSKAPKIGSRRTLRFSSSQKQPLRDIQKSSSAPNLVPQANLGSSRENPIIIDGDQLPTTLSHSTLERADDATKSATDSRAALSELGALAAGQRSRTSSASGRIEGRVNGQVVRSDVVSKPGDEIDNTMDREPSPGHSQLRPRGASPATLPTVAHVSNIEERVEANSTPKHSPTPYSSCIAPGSETSTPSKVSSNSQRKAVDQNTNHTEHEISTESCLVENEPSGMPEDDSRSEPDGGLETSHLAESIPLLETRSPANVGWDSDDLSEPSDPRADPGRPADSGSDSDMSSMLSFDHDLNESYEEEFELEIASPHSTAPAADGEPSYPDWREWEKDYNDKDIQIRLMKMIRAKIPKPINGREEGSIYIYTSPTCKGYFKVGLTYGNIPARIQAQKKCGLILERVEDPHQARFRHAGLVDKLIKWDLYHFRRKFPCKGCKSSSHGGPTKHGEWYEIELERLLMIIEKWRSWITMTENNPYNSDRALIPIWAWKLKILDEKKSLDLGYQGHLCQTLRPLTDSEINRYKRDWLIKGFRNIYDQGTKLHKTAMESFLFLLILSVFMFLVLELGLKVGLFCFVVLATLVVYMLWHF